MAEITGEPPASTADPRPVVRTAVPGNTGLWLFMGLLLLGGVWIVSLMSDVRSAGQDGTLVPAQSDGAGRISSSAPPVLPAYLQGGTPGAARGYLPPAAAPAYPRMVPQNMVPPAPVTVYRTPTPQSALAYVPLPVPQYRDALPLPASATSADASGGDGQAAGVKPSGERVSAGRIGNPALTVPLGTIIPAVLETALDSTRPGSARALVQRDVRSFDGSRVLIPRGSRLYGSYDGKLAEGQNRAVITWSRLLRPDGVTIALDSEATDPLGRAGIRGRVDTKFFQRFGGAILQSILDIGVGVVTREASDGVIVALPGSTQNVTRIAPQQITPTLRVRHGTSVSVYVARDLDFSTTDQ